MLKQKYIMIMLLLIFSAAAFAQESMELHGHLNAFILVHQLWRILYIDALKVRDDAARPRW